MWKKTNVKDGSPKTCKFCHSEVWWNVIEGRWYDVGGKTLHVENCELRREHFKNEAMNAAESRRKSSR
jgi:hypothetical protein